MSAQYIGVFLVVGLALLSCESPLGSGNFVGIIINQSSYTLNVDDPLNETKYFRLKPGEQTQRYALQDQRYTFTAYYASDGVLYTTATVRINSVENDVEIDGLTYDWAVIFIDPSWFSRFRRVEYYP